MNNIRSYGDFEINQAASLNNDVPESSPRILDKAAKQNILRIHNDSHEESKIVIQSQEFSVDGKNEMQQAYEANRGPNVENSTKRDISAIDNEFYQMTNQIIGIQTQASPRDENMTKHMSVIIESQIDSNDEDAEGYSPLKNLHTNTKPKESQIQKILFKGEQDLEVGESHDPDTQIPSVLVDS